MLGLALAATGCGNFVAPFEGVPRLPPAGVVDAGPRVAICYNALFTTPTEVRKLAGDACGVSAEPSFASQDIRGMCPLATPVRANFVCLPD
ncbi:MAG: hypothetical protein JWL84_3333 [Rhodospirillales bacterium]|nr:hypothetical protein [Rhodospirillales bacterium]